MAHKAVFSDHDERTHKHDSSDHQRPKACGTPCSLATRATTGENQGEVLLDTPFREGTRLDESSADEMRDYIGEQPYSSSLIVICTYQDRTTTLTKRARILCFKIWETMVSWSTFPANTWNTTQKWKLLFFACSQVERLRRVLEYNIMMDCFSSDPAQLYRSPRELHKQYWQSNKLKRNLKTRHLHPEYFSVSLL